MYLDNEGISGNIKSRKGNHRYSLVTLFRVFARNRFIEMAIEWLERKFYLD